MNKTEFKAKGFLIWGICAFFFIYELFLRTTLGSFQDSYMADLRLSPFKFSLISTTVFLLVYGLMQIPVGLIVDHLGLKKSLLIACISCTLSSLGFSYASSFYPALLSRLVMGFGASFGFITVLIAVSDWMPHNHNGLFIGLSQFFGTIGPMIAGGPMHILSTKMGVSWRPVFFTLCIIGFVTAILAFLFVENNQKNSGKYSILYKPEKISTSLMKLFSRSQPWFIAILSTCLYFALEYLSENEGRAYLLLKGISAESSSYIITISWIGFAIASPLIGYISDRYERRKPFFIITAVIAVISSLILLCLHGKIWMQTGFFLMGISASGGTLGFATVAEQFKTRFLAVGLGLTNAIIITISAINAPVLGYLLESVQQTSTPTLNDYGYIFGAIFGLSLLGLVVSIFFIKETYCKSAVEFTVLDPE